MTLSRFCELFVGRDDVFAEQQDDGSYLPVRRELEEEDLWRHLQGEWSIGIYTTRPEDNACKFICFDVDVLDFSRVEAIITVLQWHGVTSRQYLTEFSGRKGWHVWLFLAGWTPAFVARRAGLAVLQQANVKCEVFPKQDTVEDGYGNLVKLPLGIHRKSGKRSAFTGGCHPWEKVQPLRHDQLVALVDSWQENPTPLAVPRKQLERGALSTSMRLFLEEPVERGNRNNAIFRFALTCNRAGKDEAEALELCLQKNEQCMPPLSRREVKTIVRSAYRYQLEGR